MGAVRRVLWLLLVSIVVCGGGPALAERRVALVIGNSGYEKVAQLSNPANDASLMAETFRSAGFDSVDLRRDLNIADMRRALKDFFDESSNADIAVVFYAGHGIEVDGTNYLIPVDAVLDRDIDIYDEALSLDRVLVSVEPAKQLRLVILDACRDNPFTRTMKRTVSSRGIGRGLAKVEPTSTNTLIAFAAKAGSTASDGDGNNSPFTAALVKHITRPGLDLRKAFGYARDDVLKATGNRQEPYVYGSLGGDDVPLVPGRSAVTAPVADLQAAARRDYELALQLSTRDGWQAFLLEYPEGYYAILAKGQLSKIAAEETRAAAAEQARLAEREKDRLAAGRADKAEQEKAAAAAKLADEVRLAAEKAKQVEQARADAAEQQRKAAELATAQAPLDKQAAEKPTEPAAVKAADTLSTTENQKVAALPPATESSLSQTDLPKALQAELRRVGCLAANADGNWNGGSQHSLALFNKYAGTAFDVKLASQDALERVRAKPSRVCPLICDHGFKSEGDRCVKINCSSGSILNRKNECEKEVKQEQPLAKGKERPAQGNSAAQDNGAAIPAEGSAAVAAAAGGGCNYDACLTRCHRNTGPGTICTSYCSGLVRNFALNHRCAP